MTMATGWRFVVETVCLCILTGFFLRTFAADPLPICGAPGFHFENLTRRDAWTFTGNVCLPVNGTKPASCDFSMAFCRYLPRSSGCMQNASICLSSTDKFTLATMSGNPFNVTVLPGVTGYRMEFGPGSAFTTASNKSCDLKTVITFLCNLKELWPQDSKNPKPPTTLTYDPELCLYNMTFQFAGACPILTPAQIPTELSAGSVLLILFSVSFIVYISLGSMYKIATGHHGKDIVPNVDFWSELFLCIKDGCVFTFTCGRLEAQAYDSI